MKREHGFDALRSRQDLLEENDGAGNTFRRRRRKLIGTAVGATTSDSIIVALTHELTQDMDKIGLMHLPFLLG